MMAMKERAAPAAQVDWLYKIWHVTSRAVRNSFLVDSVVVAGTGIEAKGVGTRNVKTTMAVFAHEAAPPILLCSSAPLVSWRAQHNCRVLCVRGIYILVLTFASEKYFEASS